MGCTGFVRGVKVWVETVSRLEVGGMFVGTTWSLGHDDKRIVETGLFCKDA